MRIDLRVHATLRQMRQDMGRLFLSFLAAVALWYFIGRKVETEELFPVRVIVVSHAEEARQAGLVVRVPPQLVFQDLSPQQLVLRVRGKGEEIDRLRKELTGVWNVPVDFCGNEDSARKTIDVGSTFTFDRFRSLRSLRLLEAASLTLELRRRASARLVLGPDKVEIAGEDLPPDIAWTISPSSVEVSGAKDLIERVAAVGARLRVTLSRVETTEALKGLPLKFSAENCTVVENGETRGRVKFESPTSLELRITRTTPSRVVRLENVPIGWLNVKNVLREGIDPAEPVRTTPTSIWAEITLPGDSPAPVNLEEELRAKLNLFVDLREMPQGVEAKSLPLRVEGLPSGAAVSLELDRVDVELRRKEPTGTEGGKS
jgi:hypothetical protein